VVYNYPYFVITVDKEEYGLSRDTLCEVLTANNVFPRKYFYPLCSNLQCYSRLPSADICKLPVANKISASVLALPLYGGLTKDEVAFISNIIHLKK
jgi:Predicted pyridoxal phosphate-dependent enzyme apparently involved in regulation of cell wall biogenesis